jgi:acetyl esterase
MPLDPIVEGMLKAMAELGMPPISSLQPQEARDRMAAMRAQRPAAPDEPGVTKEDLTLGGVAARRYAPEGGHTGSVVYYHGGGWVLGTLDDFEGVAARLASTSGAQVFSVDYRLAPEAPFPAAADDAYAALVAVAQRDDAGAITVIGDSAGGNLAAVAALEARDKGGPSIALQVLVYPATDAAGTPADYPSLEENGSGEYMIAAKDMDWFYGHYAPEAPSRTDARLSPIRAADLSGLPPAVVLVSGYDPLRDEGIAYAKKLEEAGVEVELRRYDSMIHGFFGMLGIIPTADEAVAAVGESIKSAAAGVAA